MTRKHKGGLGRGLNALLGGDADFTQQDPPPAASRGRRADP